MLLVMSSTSACLQLSPVRVKQPVVGHVPTLDFETIFPEIGPGAENVNIGVGCTPAAFGVGAVIDVDAEPLSFRFFLLFEDPSEGEGVARQELYSGTLAPLPSDPTTFDGPRHTLDREELAREFRFNALDQLVTPEAVEGQPPPPLRLHELELVIADQPFSGDVDEDALPAGAGQTRVTWDVFFTRVDCTVVDPT